MTKEVRNNIIFISVLVLLMLPGAVILVRKKMQPGERPIGSPDPVRKTTAYMDPYPAETVARLAPARTLQWVAGLAVDQRETGFGWSRVRWTPEALRARVSAGGGGGGGGGDVGPGDGPDLDRGREQVVSRERLFQVVSLGSVGTKGRFARLRVIVWDGDVGLNDVTAFVDNVKGEVLAAHVEPMPKEVRHDLQDAGFVVPPERVVVVDVAMPEGLKGVLRIEAGRRKDELSLNDVAVSE